MEINLNLEENDSYSEDELIEFLMNIGWDQERVADFLVALMTHKAINKASWEEPKGYWVETRDMKRIPRRK